jgi:hypothetical protein
VPPEELSCKEFYDYYGWVGYGVKFIGLYSILFWFGNFLFLYSSKDLLGAILDAGNRVDFFCIAEGTVGFKEESNNRAMSFKCSL